VPRADGESDTSAYAESPVFETDENPLDTDES